MAGVSGLRFTWQESENIRHARRNLNASVLLSFVSGNSSMVNDDIEKRVRGLLPDFLMVFPDSLCFSRGQIARLSPMRCDMR